MIAEKDMLYEPQDRGIDGDTAVSLMLAWPCDVGILIVKRVR